MTENPVEKCVRALRHVGCTVTEVGKRPDAYKVLIPPSDEHDAPDGTEMTLSAPMFALLCERVRLEQVEG